MGPFTAASLVCGLAISPGMLIAARQLLRRQGGDLVLASASGYLQAILRAAGSFGKLEICATVEAARARFFVELSL